MLTASVLLALLAVALAWPVPVALAKAQWPDTAPGVALVLWQAIALAGVLSLLGALLTAGLAPFGAHPVAAACTLIGAALGGRLPSGTTVPALFGVSAAALIGLHLALNLVVTAVRARRQCLRHLDLVLLLSTPMADLPRTRLLNTQAPVAYCLSGSAKSVTVLSAGLLELLEPEEVDGVIAHERAHIVQHHTMLVVAFRAWRSALPWFPVASRAEDAVGVLTEMLADDRARRVASAEALAHAIGVVATAGSGTEPAATRTDTGPGADLASVRRRVRRLLEPVVAPPAAVRRAALLAATALVVVPAVLLLLPDISSALS